MNSWLVALKKYNEGKKYTVPKKGSKEYDAVRALMSDPMPKPPKSMKSPKVPKMVDAKVKMNMIENL